jgi:hypothetical protein
LAKKSGMESCPNWHQIEKREKHNEKLSFKKIASKKRIVPSGKKPHNELENHHAINGEMHYFYGDFP